ncbi:MAG TPA: cyclic nucleotide-binding domain-containing protein [Verrucomicrobiae bacterium]|nr:cyclic nucleotide-binding domain-containing protein [Verrucomicrobiae bacterium]
MRTQSYPANHVVFREGDESQDAYRILSGRVDISMGTGGKRILLARLGPGDIFGEMAMIEDKARSATATAAEDLEVEVMSPADFNRAILQDPARLVPYLASFFERLRTTNNMLRMEMRRRGAVGEGGIDRLHVDVAHGDSSVHVLPVARVLLMAASEHARARSSAEELRVDKFPFRIGRMSSGGADVLVQNDFFVRDQEPYQISRNHCAIDREGDRFYVRDRGSTLGTVVNGRPVGLRCDSISTPLKAGENRIVLGSANSPYVFLVRIDGG